jgi:hypothetical protein
MLEGEEVGGTSFDYSRTLTDASNMELTASYQRIPRLLKKSCRFRDVLPSFNSSGPNEQKNAPPL